MKENMEERAERLALYIIENQTTVRAAAQKFGISKSTVHMDDTKRNGPCSNEQGPSVCRKSLLYADIFAYMV